jgi:hypothetical protein
MQVNPARRCQDWIDGMTLQQGWWGVAPQWIQPKLLRV